MPALVSVRNGPFRDLSAAVVRRWAERMLAALDLAAAELSVALTHDGEIHELNKVFRHRDRPTDVLAFAMREGTLPGKGPRQEPEMLGDVVVSVETARRQASRRGRSLEAEVRTPGYDQDGWVAAHGYDGLSWADLLNCWEQHNLALLQVVKRLSEDRLAVKCVIGDSKTVTLGFLIEDYALHMQHHLDQILGREKITSYPGAALGV